MAGLCAGAWLVVAAVAPQLNPEALLGMVGPLASALATWIVVARTAAAAPEKTTGVMVTETVRNALRALGATNMAFERIDQVAMPVLDEE